MKTYKKLAALLLVVIVATGAAMPVVASGTNPIAIQAVWESEATAEGLVQLTVVTGTAANFVWIHFEGNRHEHGIRIASDMTSSTWVINYRPSFLTPHTVTVFSNRINSPTNAESREHIVFQHSPFIPLEHPIIQNITVTQRDIIHANPRYVAPGTEVTLNIRTNADMGAVWIRDVDGIERRATGVWPTTATQRNWEIVFTPTRAGHVVVFANETHDPWGAAQRSEFIGIGSGEAVIRHASASRIVEWHWGIQANAVIRVTTNEHTNSVWAVLPNRQLVPLRHVLGFGLSDRVWEAPVWTSGLPITIHASEAFGAVGGFSDASMTIYHWSMP